MLKSWAATVRWSKISLIRSTIFLLKSFTVHVCKKPLCTRGCLPSIQVPLVGGCGLLQACRYVKLLTTCGQMSVKAHRQAIQATTSCRPCGPGRGEVLLTHTRSHSWYRKVWRVWHYALLSCLGHFTAKGVEQVLLIVDPYGLLQDAEGCIIMWGALESAWATGGNLVKAFVRYSGTSHLGIRDHICHCRSPSEGHNQCWAAPC